jgi:hypothetical protein
VRHARQLVLEKALQITPLSPNAVQPATQAQ